MSVQPRNKYPREGECSTLEQERDAITGLCKKKKEMSSETHK